jgi:TP901-1 family phage major tail protein
MADTEELQVLQGIDKVVYYRKLADAATKEGHLLPYQTTHTFDPSKNTDSTATKSGAVSTAASVETDFEQEFIDSTDAIADGFYDSLFNDETLEVWIVSLKRKNTTGQLFSWYFRAKVQEDENDNDADDNSTRDVTFTVDGTPKRGWLTLPDGAQEEIDYIFRGLKALSGDDTTGGGTPLAPEGATTTTP